MDRALRVLLVEDSPDDAMLLEVGLRRGGLNCSIARVETLDDLRAELATGNWDVVISDFHLPGFDAGHALAELQASGKDLPFIIVSGVIEADHAVTLLKQGAHDFINKGALARLVPAIERELREAVERASRRRAEERVEILSMAVEQSPVSVVITDCDGVIEYVNPKFQEVTGYSMLEALGQSLEFTRLEQPGNDSCQRMWATVRAGHEYRGEICSHRKDGQLFWEHMTVSPITDGKGAISHFVAVKEDITVRRSYEERLLRQANFDDLTGLPNRVLMMDRLEQAIAIAHRRQAETAVLFVDLDRFKDVNDSKGHAIGDVLLKEAAMRLNGCTRDGDTVARMGGDEFLLILPGISGGTDAQRVAERVVDAFSRPFVIGGQDHFVTASIGITFYPGDGMDGRVLLRNADLAMYQAKDKGGNRYSFFTEDINRKMQERVLIEGNLRGAVARGEMCLHYQPIYDIASGEPVAAEALIRWRTSQGILLMPNQFISVAEDMGLIPHIGDWVLEAACAEMRGYQSRGLRRVAINVSPRQLRVGGFARTVEKILDCNGLSPDSLELEITEGVLMDDTAETVMNINTLCEMGVRLSIDDFGTGYSSLGYLQRYPFDTLKIDRGFVADALGNSTSLRLVETIITMAQGLGLEVIAEGVETQAQMDLLKSRRCDLAQGYLLGKPMPLEDFSLVWDRVLPALACGSV